MHQKHIYFLITVLTLSGLRCATDDDDTSQPDQPSDNDSASETETSTEEETDSANEDLDIGSSCRCEGDGCVQPGVEVPIPNGGMIVGCEAVPLNITGADLVCLRSYAGNFATNTFFAGGYCALMATRCTGDPTICAQAVFGTFDELTSCPQGTVLLSSTQLVEVELVPGTVLQATIDNKICVAPCAEAGDCREDEFDTVLQEQTEYQCIDKTGVKFCYDLRNLPDDYEVTQF